MGYQPLDFLYGRWDGSQAQPELDADQIFSQISDSLLYHGDVAAALRQLLSDGVKDRSGRRLEGLREMVERLGARRKEILAQKDPSGMLGEIAEALAEIIEIERSEIDSKLEDLNSRSEPASRAALERLVGKDLELSAIGGDPNSQIQALRHYDFESPKAKADFEQLVEKLTQQLLDSFFHSMKQGLETRGEEKLEKTRELLGDLNQLLSHYREGNNTDEEFQKFMDKWGSNFPPGINSIEDLISFMTSQMEMAASMFNSLSPEQKRELLALSESLLSDIDLGWQMSQLSENLAPFMRPGSPRYGFHGDTQFGLGEAPDIFSELRQLSDLESFMRQVNSPSDLADLDLDKIAETLGEHSRASLERLREIATALEEAGLASLDENRLELTPKGLRRIGESALRELFSKLDQSTVGDHSLTTSGLGTDLEFETKAYEFGDPFNININRTIRNALLRDGSRIPVRVIPEDFEVEKTEQLAKSSTVLLLDLSLSMPLRDNFLSAKKVAIALHSLISSKYPRDFLAIVGFSEVARRIEPAQLPEVSWDYVYGTNMEHALLMAREILSAKEGRKQILMITDGEPTAHILPNGEVFFSYPSTPETLEATLKEAMRCTRQNITINSFVLDASRELRRFMERFAALNRGRVFYTDPENLGEFVLVDFLSNRNKVM